MKTFLKILFSLIFSGIVAATVQASLERSVWAALQDFWPDAWFRATLCDTYFAFITIGVWIGYKENSWLARILWWILVLILGNIAISSYVLIQLFRLKPGEDAGRIFYKRSST